MESLGMRPGRRNAIAASASETIGGAMILTGAFTPAAATMLIATTMTPGDSHGAFQKRPLGVQGRL